MLPDIPTTAEAVCRAWSWCPGTPSCAAGTPQDIVDKLAAAMEKVATSETTSRRSWSRVRDLHGPQGAGRVHQAELVYWGEVIKKAGITLDQ